MVMVVVVVVTRMCFQRKNFLKWLLKASVQYPITLVLLFLLHHDLMNFDIVYANAYLPEVQRGRTYQPT